MKGKEATFKTSRYHAHAIVAIELLNLISYHAYEQPGVEGVWCGRMDLDHIGKRSGAFCWGLRVKKVHY